MEETIHLSGVLAYPPEIDLTKQKVGIFGKIAKLDATVQDGDRVEIYRQIRLRLNDVKSMNSFKFRNAIPKCMFAFAKP